MPDLIITYQKLNEIIFLPREPLSCDLGGCRDARTTSDRCCTGTASALDGSRSRAQYTPSVGEISLNCDQHYLLNQDKI